MFSWCWVMVMLAGLSAIAGAQESGSPALGKGLKSLKGMDEKRLLEFTAS